MSRDAAITEDLVGLEVGKRHVGAARFRVGSGGRPVLRQAGLVELPEGATDKELARAIRRLWRQAGLHTYTVSTCLRAPSLIVKHVRFPGLSEHEIASAIQVEAEMSLQRSVEELVYDWHRNPAVPGEGSGEGPDVTDGTLAAAPRHEVEYQVELLEHARLYPVNMDVAALALANLYVHTRPDEAAGESVALVHASHRHLDLAVLDPRRTVIARSLSTRPLGEEGGFDLILESVRDSLQYAAESLGRAPVQRIRACGLNGRTSDLLECIQQDTGLPAEAWDPLADLQCPGGLRRKLEQVHPDCSAMLAPALGLALGKVTA